MKRTPVIAAVLVVALLALACEQKKEFSGFGGRSFGERSPYTQYRMGRYQFQTSMQQNAFGLSNVSVEYGFFESMPLGLVVIRFNADDAKDSEKIILPRIKKEFGKARIDDPDDRNDPRWQAVWDRLETYAILYCDGYSARLEIGSKKYAPWPLSVADLPRP